MVHLFINRVHLFNIDPDGGSDRVKVDIHGSATYFLHDEITAIHDALHDIGDLLSDGLKEVRA